MSGEEFNQFGKCRCALFGMENISFISQDIFSRRPAERHDDGMVSGKMEELGSLRGRSIEIVDRPMHVDNDVFTNAAAKTVLEAATAAAKLLDIPTNQGWSEVAEGL